MSDTENTQNEHDAPATQDDQTPQTGADEAQVPQTGDDTALRQADDAIADAKDAAAHVDLPGGDRLDDDADDSLIEDGGLPVAGDSAPADGPAPAA